jgi:hypothetical protein
MLEHLRWYTTTKCTDCFVSTILCPIGVNLELIHREFGISEFVYCFLYVIRHVGPVPVFNSVCFYVKCIYIVGFVKEMCMFTKKLIA